VIIDLEKADKAIQIGRQLNLAMALEHDVGGLRIVYQLYKDDLRQYVELCRRLAGYEVDEEFIDEPMEANPMLPVGMVIAKLL